MMCTRNKPLIAVFPEFCNPYLLKDLYKNLQSEVDFSPVGLKRLIGAVDKKQETPAIQEVYKTNLKLFYPQDYEEVNLEDIVQKIINFGFIETNRCSNDRVIFKYQPKVPEMSIINIYQKDHQKLLTRTYLDITNREKVFETIADVLEKYSNYHLNHKKDLKTPFTLAGVDLKIETPIGEIDYDVLYPPEPNDPWDPFNKQIQDESLSGLENEITFPQLSEKILEKIESEIETPISLIDNFIPTKDQVYHIKVYDKSSPYMCIQEYHSSFTEFPETLATKLHKWGQERGGKYFSYTMCQVDCFVQFPDYRVPVWPTGLYRKICNQNCSDYVAV